MDKKNRAIELRETIESAARELCAMAESKADDERVAAIRRSVEGDSPLTDAVAAMEAEACVLSTRFARDCSKLIVDAATSLAPMANGKAPYDGVLSHSAYALPSTYYQLSTYRSNAARLKVAIEKQEAAE